MYFILEGDDKLKNKFNEYVRICLLIIVIALIGISYTIYYAFCHNGEVVYRSYGIDQVIAVNPSLSFLQILVIVILGLALVGAILFLVYTHAGKKSPEELLKNQEKKYLFCNRNGTFYNSFSTNNYYSHKYFIREKQHIG